MWYAILGIVVIVGSVSSYIFGKKSVKSVQLSEDEAIKKASGKAQDIIIEAEKKAIQTKNEVEASIRELRGKVDEQEKQILQREKNLSERNRQLDDRESGITEEEDRIKKRKEELKLLQENLNRQLEKVARMNQEEAKKALLKEIENDVKHLAAKKIKSILNSAEVEARDNAREILIRTMENVATDFVSETTTTTIKIEDEKLKGRIIGKEGRNIRAFEQATGVDVIIDESPEHVGISCFDPLRREIGVQVMKQLIADGRIHPGRIEEIVEKVKKEISEEIIKNGKVLAEEAGVIDIDPDLIKTLGKMKYRTSYGQSLMGHTLEVMKIGELLANEVGADVNIVKTACLLHDIGKLLSQKISKPHHHISGDIARKYGFDEKTVNAIESHHGDIEAVSVEAVIVHIADAISGARPGARKESYESYIKRIQALEDLTMKIGKNKINEVFAIHAGREVRIIVKPEEISDEDSTLLAHKIAREIEKTQTYPGTIQVTVIRETRALDTAR